MKLAFVVPWYGCQATGGAETAVRRTAEALYHRAGLDVEVLTTCSAEFGGDWGANELPAGLDVVNGVPVRRFPVRPRDAAAFARINTRLMDGQSISVRDEQVFMREMINSDALCDFIRGHLGRYFLVFTPYMFGTTWAGSAIDPDRSALIPALHDESYAYLRTYADMFSRVRGVVFYSRAEMELARGLYTLRPGAAALVPAGIDEGPETDGERFRAKHGLGPYLLYAGRKEAGKNLPLLIDIFDRYRRQRRTDLRLVVIGKGPVTAPPALEGTVLDLGFVPEQDKWDAYAGALALCQPSVHESFSIVMMEAWLAGAPSLVHGRCAVTREHCTESDGGLYFLDDREFAAAVDLLLERPGLRDALGGQGRRYVQLHFNWDVVIARYLDALRRWGLDPAELRRSGAPSIHVPPRRAATAAHQLITAFRPGDAISHHALALRTTFRSWGIASEIFAAEPLGGEPDVRPLRALPRSVSPEHVLLYHHSIHSPATDAYVETTARRVLVYHNITPADYFAATSPYLEALARRGRLWLPALIRASDRVLADSTFNATELRAHGAVCHVVPLLIDFGRLRRTVPDERVLARYGDGHVNVLFVGRIVSNKRQADVVEAFHAYRALNPRSRLLLVGNPEDDGGAYARHVRDLVRRLGLEDAVELTGAVTDAELCACFRSSHVFVSMSEHEGFCAPLVEAMHFDVPVVAYAAAAVPETLGPEGVLVEAKDYRVIAVAIDRLVRDVDHRTRVIAAQRRRLKDFEPAVVAAMLRDHLADLLQEPGDRGQLGSGVRASEAGP